MPDVGTQSCVAECCVGLQMEYEDLLPFSDFAVRVPQSMIYRLPFILEQMVVNQSNRVRPFIGQLYQPDGSGASEGTSAVFAKIDADCRLKVLKRIQLSFLKHMQAFDLHRIALVGVQAQL